MTYNMDQVKEVIYTNNDAKFIVENWEQITEEQALSINSHLQTWINYYKEKHIAHYFYKCNQFDTEQNLCKVHSTLNGVQTRVCYGYPDYGRFWQSENHKFYSPNCGFNKEGLILNKFNEIIEK